MSATPNATSDAEGRAARPPSPAADRRERLSSDVSLIASEFLAGFQAVERIDRPAVSIFGSARVLDGTPTYERARATGRAFAEAFAVVTGGGPGSWRPRIAAAGKEQALHRLRAAPSKGSIRTATSRVVPSTSTRAQVMFVKAAEGSSLPRRLRDAGRALGGARADPDREDRQLPGRALRLPLLGRAPRLAPRGDARRRPHLAQGRVDLHT